jgi:Fe-S oxidoreductase
MTALHHGLENAAGPQSLCVSCNACELVCPAEIPIPRMILDVRARATEAFGLPNIKAMALARWSAPGSGARWAGLASRAAGLVSDDERVIRKLPFQAELTQGRTLMAPARRPLRERVRRAGLPEEPLLPSSQARGLRVAYFPGCLTDRMLPEQGEAVLRVLRACGCEVSFPTDQHCCGLVALNVGDRAHGRQMAEQTIRMLEALDVDYVVTNSTSCLAAVAQDYQHLFRADEAWRARAEAVGATMIDFTTFVAQVARPDAADFTTCAPTAVTCHDACQSANALGLGADMRTLLVDTLGCELREMQDSSVCCGFGGSFSVDYPGVSTAILRKKLDHAQATSAAVIVSDNPGCLMQINGGLRASGSPAHAMHIAELLASRLPEVEIADT